MVLQCQGKILEKMPLAIPVIMDNIQTSRPAPRRSSKLSNLNYYTNITKIGLKLPSTTSSEKRRWEKRASKAADKAGGHQRLDNEIETRNDAQPGADNSVAQTREQVTSSRQSNPLIEVNGKYCV